MFGQRLWVMGKYAGRLSEQGGHLLDTQTLQKSRQCQAASRVDTVECYGEIGSGNGLCVNQIQFQNTVDMVINGAVVGLV